MSYCRFSRASDVYVYQDPEEGICCFCCSLVHGEDYVATGKPRVRSRAMLAHLMEHVAAGQLVPQRAIARLSREIEGDPT